MKIIINERQLGILTEKYSDRPFNPIKTAITSTLAKGLNLPHSSRKEREFYTDIVREIENGNFEMVKEPSESYWGGDNTEVKVVLNGKTYFVKPRRERINLEGTIMCSVKISYDDTWFHIYGCKHFRKLTEIIKKNRFSKINNAISLVPKLLNRISNGDIVDVDIAHYYKDNRGHIDVSIEMSPEISETMTPTQIREKYLGTVENAISSISSGEFSNFNITYSFH